MGYIQPFGCSFEKRGLYNSPTTRSTKFHGLVYYQEIGIREETLITVADGVGVAISAIVNCVIDSKKQGMFDFDRDKVVPGCHRK
ncbi:hypothetical protein TNCV_1345981 [Trichonephila clavipes]|nr:hypothetical protein TNCV_1345981 [Trichonephila clavipes]